MAARMKGSRALKEIVPVGLAACVATAALLASPPEGTGAVSTPSPPSGSSVAGAAPAPSTAAIIASPTLPEQPAAGKGRLTILFSGNRRWCTFPDDRTVKPPPDPRKSRQVEATRNEIYTFGYKFSISAVRRGVEDNVLLLYESPLFRTAALRTASKVDRGAERKTPLVGPGVGARPIIPGPGARPAPASLVPYWDETYRCTVLPDHFDFDLDPGTYDVYAAFDIMNREGDWTHRTNGYLTDVSVEASRRTRLDGTANMLGMNARDLSLDKAILLPSDGGAGAGVP